jgi:hypothetical protein
VSPRSRAQTRPATADDARAYLAKAREYLQSAEDAHARDHYVAAAGTAVLAGIAAADAVAGVRSGSVWMGEHGQAAAYLEGAAGTDGAAAARQLRRLMPLKNRTEYDPAQLSETESAGAVEAARRIVAVAERAVQG